MFVHLFVCWLLLVLFFMRFRTPHACYSPCSSSPSPPPSLSFSDHSTIVNWLEIQCIYIIIHATITTTAISFSICKCLQIKNKSTKLNQIKECSSMTAKRTHPDWNFAAPTTKKNDRYAIENFWRYYVRVVFHFYFVSWTTLYRSKHHWYFCGPLLLLRLVLICFRGTQCVCVCVRVRS